MNFVFDVPRVPVQQLHERLGFAQSVEYPEASLVKSLTDWKMEDDDAPLFRYVYRHFRPCRHLEFGTWQGTGVTYVLDECDATVWTINLLEGESKDSGEWAYGENHSAGRMLVQGWTVSEITGDNQFAYRTDARGFIGRFYLDRGLGHRVCQIYADSRDWDTSNYPAGFFDSCLIDGGHRSEVVLNDTQKAVQLVRSGGIVMWHDFCPVREVMEQSDVVRGVVTSLQSNWSWLTDQMKYLAWIQPSHILIGVRK